MKPTRLQRAWLAWLALPAVMRIAAYIVILCVVLAVWPKSCMAQSWTAKGAGDVVHLSTGPCQLPEHQLLPEGIPPEYRAAWAIISRQRFVACWVKAEPGVVVLIFDDGEWTQLPAAAFKRDDT